MIEKVRKLPSYNAFSNLKLSRYPKFFDPKERYLYFKKHFNSYYIPYFIAYRKRILSFSRTLLKTAYEKITIQSQ